MLAFDARGSGPRPLVLLHGFLGSGRNLASLARRLAERDPALRLVLPDLTGHGASPPLPPAPGLEHLAADVLELCRGLGAAEVELVGHSLGGRVALVARDLAPAEIGRVTLLDISPRPIPSQATQLEHVLAALLRAPATSRDRAELRRYFSAAGVSGPLTDWLLTNLAPSAEGLAWRIDRAALAALHANTRSLDLWPLLVRAESPTRVIRGGRSPFVPDEDAAALAEHGCEVRTIAGAGHFLHVEAQEELLELLLAPA